MRIVATIESRMGSSRLPGKSMKKIVGKPMLQLLIERVKKCNMIDKIIVATTTNPENDIIEKLALELSVNCYRGSEENVLERVLQAAKSVNGDVILELWGDNPLIDPTVLDQLIKYYKENSFDLVGTTLPNFDKKYPTGISALIFSTKILDEVNSLTNNPIDRENVSNYIYEHPEKYRIAALPCPVELNFPEMRFTVDEQVDFDLINTIFENLYTKNPNFSAVDAIRFLNSNPKLKNLNKHVVQRRLPGWEKLGK